jgi:NADH:ubiquinone oxidoreductase subunit F (NADH-binding)
MTSTLRLVTSDEDELFDAVSYEGETSVLPVDLAYSANDSESVIEQHRQDLEEHLASFGPRPSADGRGGDNLLADITTIGLTGKGGGQFPTARKWRAVLGAGGGGVVVVNGAESEKCSAKDAALLQHRPHLVLDGAVAAAETLGSPLIIVWLHAGATANRRNVERALTQRRAQGFVEPTITVRTGPNHYLSGESSAIINALSGGPAVPIFHRVPSAVSGVRGAPTLVSNVETFARVALVARTGAARYRPATLLTVVRSGRRLVRDTPHHQTIADAVGGFGTDEQPSAVLLGGYGGTWARWEEVRDLRVVEEEFREAGHSLGAGVIIPLGPNTCGLTETARILRYLSSQSARQCGPCMFGLDSISTLLSRLAFGSANRSDLKRLQSFSSQIFGRGGCRHPDGAVRLVTTALRIFEPDVQSHVVRNRCLHRGTPAVIPVPEPR